MASSASKDAPAKPRIGLWGAVAVVLGNIIGSSIYFSLHYQSQALPDAWSILAAWVFGGFLAWCGAVSYSELAAMYPENGGEAAYLEKIYHPSVGFLSGWISLFAGFPAPTAVMAVLFGDYASQLLFPQLERESALTAARWVAAALILGTTAAHCFSLRLADRVQQAFTWGKIALLVLLTLAIYFYTPVPQQAVFQATEKTWESITSSGFFVQVYFVLYAYTGWNAACYISSEVKDAPRVVPKAILLALLIAGLFYVGINFVCLRCVPMEALQSRPEVLLTAAQQCFGPTGSRLTATLICLGMISSVSAMLWVGSRVTHKIAEQHPLLKPLAPTNSANVPVRAVLFQCTVSLLILALFSDPVKMVNYVTFLLQVSAFMAVLGVFILRFRQPHLDRPYRTFGYPVVPAVFLLWTIIATNKLMNDNPQETGRGLITLVIGLALWVAGSNGKGVRTKKT